MYQALFMLGAFLLSSVFFSTCAAAESLPPVRVGWIGAMTGPVSKYAAHQSATLAMEEINSNGGIKGRPLQLVFQDGKCQARDAIAGVNALIEKEGIHLIVGGHCSTESLAIAPIVERSGALMLAATSSSPKLSTAGENVFRMTAPNIRGIEILVPHIIKSRSERKIAMVYEETEYAEGMAEFFAKLFVEQGGSIASSLAYKLGEGDFLPLATRIKASRADAIYLSVQSPDSAILFLKKARQLGLALPTFGNEISGNAILSASPEDSLLFDGMIFAEPQLASSNPKSQSFTQAYKQRFDVEKLPNGFWSAEAFDAVNILADVIRRCGEEVAQVRQCLYAVKSFEGASGSVAFDENGDGIRHYGLKRVSSGRIHDL